MNNCLKIQNMVITLISEHDTSYKRMKIDKASYEKTRKNKPKFSIIITIQGFV